MKLNPIAVVFWLFLAGIGYLAHGTINGAIAWAVAGIGISLAVDIWSR